MTLPRYDNPIDQFRDWYAEAEESPLKYVNQMALATVREDGTPDVRIVLLKGVDERGFVFYTNLESSKGRQLARFPHAALCIYWEPTGGQVRVRGPVDRVSEEEADAYFATRHRVSRLGAWASDQSRPIDGHEELERKLAEVEERFAGADVPRPPHWSGFRIRPDEIEFWREGDYRLHDRRLYRRTGDRWESILLSP